MNLRHLEVLVNVVECGSVTKAAEKLYIAQPSVSQTIAEIEKEYSIMLFQRLNKRLYLTDIGKTVYEKAKLLLKEYSQLDELMKDNNQINAIRIGASVTVGNCILSDILTSFSACNCVTYDNIIVDNTERIVKHILDGSLDVAIVEGNIDNDNIVVNKVCSDEVILVAGSNYDISSKVLHNFIVREVGSGTRDLAIECAKSAEFKIDKLWEISSTQAILDMLRLKGSATGISRLLVADKLKTGELIILSNAIKRRWFYLIAHKDKAISGIMRSFINYVTDSLYNKAKE